MIKLCVYGRCNCRFHGVWQTITITSRKPPWSNQWLYLTKKKHGKYMSVNWWWWRVGCTLHYLCCLANYGNLSKPFIFWGFGNQPKMDFWFRNCGHLRRFTYTWIVCRPSFAFTHHTLLLAPMFLPHIYIYNIYNVYIYIYIIHIISYCTSSTLYYATSSWPHIWWVAQWPLPLLSKAPQFRGLAADFERLGGCREQSHHSSVDGDLIHTYIQLYSYTDIQTYRHTDIQT